MIFNKNRNGSAEMNRLSGWSYAANTFANIESDILLATQDLIRLIGRDVYDRAERYYMSDLYTENGTQTDDLLVCHVQQPIAMAAMLAYYQGNIVSHEDTGRKVKIDSENEKIAWEWMYDRDDDAMCRKHYQALDNLYRFLETERIPEWMSAPQRQEVDTLLVRSVEQFEQAYPIDHSYRFFYLLVPFIRDAQEIHIRPALGSLYDEIVGAEDREVRFAEVLYLVRRAVPLFAVMTAVRRLSVRVLPVGIVQQCYDSNQVTRGQSVPSEILTRFLNRLRDEAREAMDRLNLFVGKVTDRYKDYPIVPNNDPRNKYFRT